VYVSIIAPNTTNYLQQYSPPQERQKLSKSTSIYVHRVKYLKQDKDLFGFYDLKEFFNFFN
jgi:hypothetical protein